MQRNFWHLRTRIDNGKHFLLSSNPHCPYIIAIEENDHSVILLGSHIVSNHTSIYEAKKKVRRLLLKKESKND